MKKSVFACLTVLCFLLASCVSISGIPKEKQYSLVPDDSTDYRVEIDSVVVTKDAVKDNDLALQVYELSKTALADLINKNDNNKTLYLDIEIKQRSYYKGIKQKNSIFLFYSLLDEDGETSFNSSYLITSSDSIAFTISNFFASAFSMASLTCSSDRIRLFFFSYS